MTKRGAGGLSPLLFLILFGCSSQSVMLVHPQSGATIKCGATGTGMMAGAAQSLVEECSKRYESQGYVDVEKLTPQQRVDLERRGVLPKLKEPSSMM